MVKCGVNFNKKDLAAWYSTVLCVWMTELLNVEETPWVWMALWDPRYLVPKTLPT